MNISPENQLFKDRICALKNSDAIWEMFGTLFESWMDENDKLSFVRMVCEQAKTSVEILNDQIEAGIKNGCSVGKQVEILKKVFSKGTVG